MDCCPAENIPSSHSGTTTNRAEGFSSEEHDFVATGKTHVSTNPLVPGVRQKLSI